MTIGLYFLSLILAIVAINIWSKEDDEAANAQQLQTLLDVSAAASGLAGLILFCWGFVLFSWFVPLAALVLSLFAGTAGAMLARRSGSPVGTAIGCGLVSVSLAAVFAYLSLQG